MPPNAKQIPYKSPAHEVAASFGHTSANVLSNLARFYDNFKNKGITSGGNPEVFKSLQAFAGSGAVTAEGKAQLNRFLTTGQTDGLNPDLGLRALGYALKEQGRVQQTKSAGILGKLASFAGPLVGLATGNPFIGAAVGGLAGGATNGLRGALIGAAGGGAAGYFSPGAGSLLSGAKTAAAGGFTNPAALGIAGHGAAPTLGAALGGAGPLSGFAASLYTPASLATAGAAAGGSGILAAVSKAAKSPVGLAARGASAGNSVVNAVKKLNTPATTAAATLAAGFIGSRAGSAGADPAVNPDALRATSTGGSKVVDIGEARARREAEAQRTRASEAKGFGSTVRTGPLGLLGPADTRRKRILGG